MLQFMLQVRPTRIDLSRLRWIMSGASPVPVTLIEAYAELGIEIHQVYGLTESCGPACLISPDEALKRAGSTGKEFFFTKVRVVDEDGNDVPPDTPGELICAGHHIMIGYWNRPEATAETIVDGWLHTGDIAVVDKDGYVYISDRIKDMIISGGENVYPAEIENVLLGHPGVADVAVIGRPSRALGRDAARRRRPPRPRPHRAGRRRVHRRQAGPLQASDRGRLRRRDPAEPDGQGRSSACLREQFPDPAP